MMPIPPIGDPDGPPGVRYRPVKPGYVVGDDGSVWSRVVPGPGSALGPTWRRLKSHSDRYGRLSVSLSRGDQGYVHHLVLAAFGSPRPPGAICRHRDGDPGNNHAGNLEWTTRKEIAVGRIPRFGVSRGEANVNSILTTRDVLDALRLRRAGETHRSIAGRFGVSREALRDAVTGRTWGHVTGLGPPGTTARRPGRTRPPTEQIIR